MSFSSYISGAPVLGVQGAGTGEATTAMLLLIIPSAAFPLVRVLVSLELFKCLKTLPEHLASRTEGAPCSDHTAELLDKQAKV